MVKLLDLGDVDPFTAVLLGLDTDPGRASRSDVNQDASVNGRDVARFVELLLGS